eukprot:TRINITY_DN2882_c0_g3_i1.p1 TRINITY_DN2882_c0_g3~~TRINITY_DN2882_c0_g3_i1.p1  ORF type:complete len:151 (+),score=15.54 TRINITY_DN2882_c0_g3_i1:742-1194(+)
MCLRTLLQLGLAKSNSYVFADGGAGLLSAAEDLNISDKVMDCNYHLRNVEQHWGAHEVLADPVYSPAIMQKENVTLSRQEARKRKWPRRAPAPDVDAVDGVHTMSLSPSCTHVSLKREEKKRKEQSAGAAPLVEVRETRASQNSKRPSQR